MSTSESPQPTDESLDRHVDGTNNEDTATSGKWAVFAFLFVLLIVGELIPERRSERPVRLGRRLFGKRGRTTTAGAAS